MYSSYDPTPSPIAGYGSPSAAQQQTNSGSVLSRISKTSTTSPTPAQTAWSLRQQPVTEGYNYSQLSPSRSPGGPTYTQLSGGSRGTPYQPAPGNPGKFPAEPSRFFSQFVVVDAKFLSWFQACGLGKEQIKLRIRERVPQVRPDIPVPVQRLAQDRIRVSSSNRRNFLKCFKCWIKGERLPSKISTCLPPLSSEITEKFVHNLKDFLIKAGRNR